MDTQYQFEVLDIEEYSQRLKVGRTTIFKWLREGTLLQGQHFIKSDKILRFVWTLDAVRTIDEQLLKQNSTTTKRTSSTPTRKIKKKTSVNLDYH